MDRAFVLAGRQRCLRSWFERIRFTSGLVLRSNSASLVGSLFGTSSQIHPVSYYIHYNKPTTGAWEEIAIEAAFHGSSRRPRDKPHGATGNSLLQISTYNTDKNK